jgi:hypothetical protein
MKCDDCKHKKFHSPGSINSVAEGRDDPYNYEYCNKDHWCGDNTIPESINPLKDQWINCKDFNQK